MAGLDDFAYPRSRQRNSNEHVSWSTQSYPGKRPLAVPQFESETRTFYSSADVRSIEKEAESKEDFTDGNNYAGSAISVAGLVAESVFGHPFVVFRRTCQVSSTTFKYHRTPPTLIPVCVRLYRSQGFPCLWKGFGSSLIVRGLTLTAEDCVSKFMPWPKDFESCSSLKSLGQHLLLKATSLAVVTPFFSVSLIESVQSEIASERPGIFDIFKEGLSRLISGGGPRALPMWYLVPATVAYGLAHHLILSVVKLLTSTLLRSVDKQKQESCGAVSKHENIPGALQYRERISSMVGHLVGDILLFPLETVLLRLHLQGSRTIIDNLDSGIEVLPVTTGYWGISDCTNEIIVGEGYRGFYRGFGAVVIQYGIQLAVIRLSTISVQKLIDLFKDDPLPPISLRPDVEPSRTSTFKVNHFANREETSEESRRNFSDNTFPNDYGSGNDPWNTPPPNTSHLEGYQYFE